MRGGRKEPLLLQVSPGVFPMPCGIAECQKEKKEKREEREGRGRMVVVPVCSREVHMKRTEGERKVCVKSPEGV